MVERSQINKLAIREADAFVCASIRKPLMRQIAAFIIEITALVAASAIGGCVLIAFGLGLVGVGAWLR